MAFAQITKEEVLEKIDPRSFYNRELKRLGEPNSKGWAQAICPFHNDKTPSLSVNLQKGHFHCFGCNAKGSIFDFYMKRYNADFPAAVRDLGEIAGIRKTTAEEIKNQIKLVRRRTLTSTDEIDYKSFKHIRYGVPVKVYDYTDADGKVLYRSCRYEDADGNKHFRQCDANGFGRVKHIDKVPYRLPEILKSDAVFIVEGEKDADNLSKIGFTATSNVGGAGKWLESYNEHFENKDIIIVPDNDDAGRNHAQKVKKSLRGTAKSIKIVDLPGLEEKGDVSDWIDNGGTKETLNEIVNNTKAVQQTVRSKKLKSIRLPSPAFPYEVISGLAGKFTEIYSKSLEVPKEFLYMSYLTCLGTYLSDKVTINSEISPQPRLFVLLLGESASERKSTALHKTTFFFKQVLDDGQICNFSICNGVGSAEGLQKRFEETDLILLCIDEFKALASKMKIQGSVLLPCINTLFESNRYENSLKKSQISLDNARLGLLAASTIETYKNMFSPAFMDIGFTNRLFLVPGRGERKYSIPRKVDPRDIFIIKSELIDVLAHVDKHPVLKFTSEAKEMYHDWYMNMEQSVHSKRVDVYALRFMPLLAVNELKNIVDTKIVKKVIALCDWQISVRKQNDPIDADNKIAHMEERIRRVLQNGPRSQRELKQYTNANRSGLWCFKSALKHLEDAEEIVFNTREKRWTLLP